MTLPPPIATITSAPCSRAAATPARASRSWARRPPVTPRPAAQPGSSRRAGRVLARAHQRPEPQPGQHARQFRRPAGAGDDPAGGAELEGRRGHGEPRASLRPPPGTPRRTWRIHVAPPSFPPPRPARRRSARSACVLPRHRHHGSPRSRNTCAGSASSWTTSKPSTCGLGQRRPRVEQRGGEEILNPFGRTRDMNMDDQHAPILLHGAGKGPGPRRASSRADSHVSERQRACPMMNSLRRRRGMDEHIPPPPFFFFFFFTPPPRVARQESAGGCEPVVMACVASRGAYPS